MSGNENNLILFGRFYSHTEAHIYRGKLENAGIECFIFDDFHSTSAWHMGYAIGGVRLMIRAGDADRASALIEENLEARAQDDIKADDTMIPRQPWIWSLISVVVTFFSGAPFILKKKKP
jgi:hypothetical protein